MISGLCGDAFDRLVKSYGVFPPLPIASRLAPVEKIAREEAKNFEEHIS